MIKKIYKFFQKKIVSNKGFSLMELSIAIAAIATIVGVTTGGVTMIKKARISTIIAKINEYTVAVEKFKSEYNQALPGDISNISRIAGAVAGNGNGVIDTDAEAVNFWRHLSLAGMLEGNYDGVSGNTPGKGVPVGSLEKSGYSVLNSATTNIPGISGQMLVFKFSSFVGGASDLPILTPEEAYNLDKKSDDGLPNSGIIRAGGGSSCILSDGSYNIQFKEESCLLYFIVQNAYSKDSSENNAISGECSVLGEVREKPDSPGNGNDERCPEGYTGKIIERCNINSEGVGSWEIGNKICQPITCSGNKTYGEKRILACINGQEGNEGKDSGGITQICSSSGSWVEVTRECMITADILKDESCTSGDQSYQLACGWFQSGSAFMTCNSDNNWDNITDNCSAVVTCPGINIDGQSPSPIGTKRESIRSCGTYYTGEVYEVCAPDGNWHESGNSCVPSYGSCNAPASNRDISCPVGEIGKHTQKCVDFGSNDYWITEQDSCSPVKCGSFNLGEYKVSVDACSNSGKGVVMDICSLSSDGLSGEWLKDESNCTEPICKGYGNEEGFASWKDVDAGETVSGVCLEGYKKDLGIAPTRQCDASGNWKAVSNPCVRKTCPEITSDNTDIFQGFATWPESYSMTENVKGQCFEGYTGSPIRNCNTSNNEDAEWGEVVPGFECKGISEAYIYSIAKDGSVRKVNAETGAEIWSYTSPSGASSSVVVDDKGEAFIGDFLSPYEIRRVDDNGEELSSLKGHNSAVNALSLFNMHYLLSGDSDGNVMDTRLYSPNNVNVFEGMTVWNKNFLNGSITSLDSSYKDKFYIAGESYSNKITLIITRDNGGIDRNVSTSRQKIFDIAYNHYYHQASSEAGVLYGDGNYLKYYSNDSRTTRNWSVNIGGEITSVDSDLSSNAFVATKNSYLAKVDSKGTIIWKHSFSDDVPEGFDDIVLGDNHDIYAVDHEGSVVKISETGEILWTFVPKLGSSAPSYENMSKKIAITPGKGAEANWPGSVARPSLWFNSLAYFSIGHYIDYFWEDVSKNVLGEVPRFSTFATPDNSTFWRDTINNKYVYTLPGDSSKRVLINSKDYFNTEEFTLFLLLRPDTINNDASIFEANNSVIGTHILASSNQIAAINTQEGSGKTVKTTLDISAQENYIVTQSQGKGIQKLSLNNGTVNANFSKEIDNSFINEYDTRGFSYLYLGGYNSKFFHGKIGEVIVYNRLLSSVEKKSVENYLSEKWEIPLQNTALSTLPNVSNDLKLWYDANDPFGYGEAPSSNIQKVAVIKNKVGSGFDLEGNNEDDAASLKLNSINGLPAVDFTTNNPVPDPGGNDIDGSESVDLGNPGGNDIDGSESIDLGDPNSGNNSTDGSGSIDPGDPNSGDEEVINNKKISLMTENFDSLQQPNTIFVVASNSNTASGYLFSSGSESAYYRNDAYILSGKYGISSASSYDSNITSPTGPYIASYEFNGNQSKIYINGILKEFPIEIGSGRMNSFVLGNNASGTSGFNGKIGEVLVYNGIVGYEDRVAIENYLSEKWGIEIEESTNKKILYTTISSKASSKIKTSNDSKQWEDYDLTIPGIIKSCAYSKEGRWAFGDNQGNIYHSEDVLTWEEVNLPSGGGANISSIATNHQGLWLASSSDNSSQIYYSKDNATNWFLATHVSVSDASWNEIAYSKEGIIAVGSNALKNKAAIAISFDQGVTWNDIGSKFPSSENLYSIDYDSTSKRFITGGENGSIYFSDDVGDHWTKVIISGNDNISDLLFADGKWVVTIGREIYYSENGGSVWKKSIIRSGVFGSHTKIGYYNGIWSVGPSYPHQHVLYSKQYNNPATFYNNTSAEAPAAAVSCFMYK